MPSRRSLGEALLLQSEVRPPATVSVNPLFYSSDDVTERGSILPLGRYPYGYDLAWPQAATDLAASYNAWRAGGYVPGRRAPEDAALAGEAFNIAGSASTGGFGAARVWQPRNAIGSAGGKLGEPSVVAAKRLGFDTDNTWWHGSTRNDLTEITPGYDEPGAWFSRTKKIASDYARGETPGMYEVFLRPNRTMIVEADYTPDGTLRMLHDGMPLDFDNNVDVVRYAQQRGYDSVRFPYGNFSEADDTMVVFDPDRIMIKD